jgi:hypothetical protein
MHPFELPIIAITESIPNFGVRFVIDICSTYLANYLIDMEIIAYSSYSHLIALKIFVNIYPLKQFAVQVITPFFHLVFSAVFQARQPRIS